LAFGESESVDLPDCLSILTHATQSDSGLILIASGTQYYFRALSEDVTDETISEDRLKPQALQLLSPDGSQETPIFSGPIASTAIAGGHGAIVLARAADRRTFDSHDRHILLTASNMLSLALRSR
jgi:hypothetical protein